MRESAQGVDPRLSFPAMMIQSTAAKLNPTTYKFLGPMMKDRSQQLMSNQVQSVPYWMTLPAHTLNQDPQGCLDRFGAEWPVIPFPLRLNCDDFLQIIR